MKKKRQTPIKELLYKIEHKLPLTKKEAERLTQYNAAAITFNRSNHPAAKFKGVTDYGKGIRYERDEYGRLKTVRV